MDDDRRRDAPLIGRSAGARPPSAFAEQLPAVSDDILALADEEWAEEIVRLLDLPHVLPQLEREARIIRALSLFKQLEPADGVEEMLAAQMVGTHYAVVRAFENSIATDQPQDAREMYLKQAMRLMDLYIKQTNVLDKRRGRGQQKVTVEHVTVTDGGQAIVGNVNAGGAPRSAEGSKKPKAQSVRERRRPVPRHGTSD